LRIFDRLGLDAEPLSPWATLWMSSSSAVTIKSYPLAAKSFASSRPIPLEARVTTVRG
jgi:hypothetical protein